MAGQRLRGTIPQRVLRLEVAMLASDDRQVGARPTLSSRQDALDAVAPGVVVVDPLPNSGELIGFGFALLTTVTYLRFIPPSKLQNLPPFLARLERECRLGERETMKALLIKKMTRSSTKCEGKKR